MKCKYEFEYQDHGDMTWFLDGIEIDDADPWTTEHVLAVVTAIHMTYSTTRAVRNVKRVQMWDDPQASPMCLTMEY